MRVFVAIPVPARVAERLDLLMTGVEDARWQAPEQLHLTLRFIGEAEERRVEDLAYALRALTQESFRIELTGAGAFGERGRAHALWVGVEASEPLARLHAKVGRLAVASGFPPDSRAFLPHVTVARLPRRTPRPDQWIASLQGRSFGSMPVERVGLFESRPGRDGSSYDLLAACRLNGRSVP